jgi:hypothetical protein
MVLRLSISELYLLLAHSYSLTPTQLLLLRIRLALNLIGNILSPLSPALVIRTHAKQVNDRIMCAYIELWK